MEIEHKTILITGSTGFIGSHLAKRLIRFCDTQVRGLVKDQTTPTHLIDGSLVEKAFGDMTSLNDMRNASRGCDVVVHCAVGEPNENSLGTRNVIQAALENGVKKFIHISSTAVYSYTPSPDKAQDGRLNYEHSKNEYHTSYSLGKIASEKVAFSYYDSCKLPLVVLRLSHVFGPYSACWTTRPMAMLDQGCYTLVNEGLSPSNTIYIDNAIDAIVSAIREDNAIGHALIISDDKITTWKDFFSSYAKMMPKRHPILGINQRDLQDERARKKVEDIKRIYSNPTQLLSILQSLNENNGQPFLSSLIGKYNLKKRFPLKRLKKLSALRPYPNFVHLELPKLPEVWLEKTFTIPFAFSVDGAKEILGFRPKVTFKDAMLKTERWLDDFKADSFDNSYGILDKPEILVHHFRGQNLSN